MICPATTSLCGVTRRIKREREKANSPVVQVVQLEGLLERLSDCRTVPYLRFFLVRNEEAGGSNPLSSTNIFSKLNNLPNPAKFDQLGELGVSRIFAFWKRKSHACSLCPS